MSIFFPNEPRRQPPYRAVLLGGTSEIGLAILAALSASGAVPAGAEVILAGRDVQRLAAAGK